MKVAITHTRYTFKGGVERYAFDLVKRLLDAGHEVHYFCHFWDEQADPRAKLHRIPNPWKQIRFMKVWSFDRWLTSHVRREEFDIVHGFSKSSFQDIYTDGSGCLLDYQGYSIEQAGGGRLSRSLRKHSVHQRQVLAIEQRRFSRGNFHRIVTMSELVADQIKRRYGLSDDEVVTIYNGIDIERFHPNKQAEWRADFRERLATTPDCFMILCIGNDYRRKGIPTLIEAARIIEDRGGLPGGRHYRFCVVGKERHSREKELSQHAKALGVYHRLKFYGPQDHVDRWHAMADMFVLPTRFDAFGNVVLEAMASGVPALISSKAGASEVVEHGHTGWVQQDPTDATAIADRVMQLAGDEDRRLAMGKASREAAERYTWDVHFEHMLALYEEVAALKRRPAAEAS
jgi:UDP-glucose:(heptosyl)LPS alpha-1,3-glucosyltransferase